MEGDASDPNLPQSGMFRRFSPNLILQGVGLASPKLSKNPSKSPRLEVEDFKKCGFLINQGTKRSQYFCNGEYFNAE